MSDRRHLFLLGSLVLGVLMSASPCAAAEGQGASRPLRSGWFHWDPYQVEERRGPLRQLTGLDIELVTRILAESGRAVTFDQVDWDIHLQELSRGERDIAAGAYETPERAEYAWFSEAYRIESDVLVVRRRNLKYLAADSPKALLAALASKKMRVGLVRGVYHGPEIEAFAKNPATAGLVSYADKDNTNLSRLLAGSIDAFFADRLAVAAVSWRAGVQREIAQHPVKVYSSGVHVMFSKKSTSPADVEAFNLGLNRLKESGEYAKILRNYAMPVLLAITVQAPWFTAFEVIGAIAFAISGVLIARREGYDIFGAFVLASLPAAGGGILRDLLAGREPLTVVASPIYLYSILATVTVGAILFKAAERLAGEGAVPPGGRTASGRLSSKIYQFFDAVGLAAFTVVGVVVAVETRCEPLWLWGPLLAVITGAGGGILRDTLRADSRNPGLQGSLYPEVSIVWGLIFSLFLIWEASRLHLHEVLLGVLATIAGALATRLLVLRYDLHSPLLSRRGRKPPLVETPPESGVPTDVTG